MKMQLYSFWRSSAAFRVRIALNLKGLDYEVIPVHLNKNGGEQLQSEYAQKNPTRLVPLLIDDKQPIHQSLAIIEYLEEIHPNPPLLPISPIDRAWVRSLAMDIAADIHPISNLRVLRYLVKKLEISVKDKDAWYQVRQLVADAQVDDFQVAYKYMFEQLPEFSYGHDAELSVVLDEHIWRAGVVPDKEINFAASIAKILETTKKQVL